MQPLWKTAWTFLKKKTKLKIELIIPLMGTHQKKKKLIKKDTLTPMATAELFTIDNLKET